MTANDRDDTASDNSGVTREDLDAQTVLDYVRQKQNVTVDGLAKRAGVTKDELRWTLDELQQHDLITVEQGMRAVHVRPTDVDDSVATDGGVVGKLLGAVSADQPSIDIVEQDLYECLADERRRQLIQFLAGLYDGDGLTFIEVSTLAEALAGSENDGDLVTDEVHRNYVSLVQVHLPLLDHYNLIEYYDRPQKLRATEDAVAVADLMAEIGKMCDGEEWYDADARGEDDEDGGDE